jgi:hypothetical protein
MHYCRPVDNTNTSRYNIDWLGSAGPNPADALRQLVGDGRVWLQRSKTGRQAVKSQSDEAAAAMREISAAARAIAHDLRTLGH